MQTSAMARRAQMLGFSVPTTVPTTSPPWGCAMAAKNVKENTGAWVVHHGKKLVLDSSGPAEYPAIDQAAKAATLLAKLGETNDATVPRETVKAIAIASGLNPHYELN